MAIETETFQSAHGYVNSKVSEHDIDPSSHIGIQEYISGHIIDTNNPHHVTKDQVSLGNVENLSVTSEIATHDDDPSSHIDIQESLLSAIQSATSNSFDKVNDTSDDIIQGTDNLFLTPDERTQISKTTGTNTGDQDLSHFATIDQVALKQDILIAGAGIQISSNNTISSSALKVEKVDALPTIGTVGVLYLLIKSDSGTQDIYDEFIWVEDGTDPSIGSFEHIGTTQIDLSNYYTKSESDQVLSGHTGNTNNPHGVTKTQVGLGNVEDISISQSISEHDTDPSAHTDIRQYTDRHIYDTNNPHIVSKDQVGLGNVEDVSISQSIFDHDTDPSSHLDIRRELNDHTANVDNPHQVTKIQVGLDNVENISIKYDWYIDEDYLKRYDDNSFSIYILDNDTVNKKLWLGGILGNPTVIEILSGTINGDYSISQIGTNGEDYFSWPHSISSITIDDVTHINESIFAYNTNLIQLSIVDAVYIGYKALFGCSGIVNISLPNVTQFSTDSFYQTSLESVGLVTPNQASGFYQSSCPAGCKIKVPYEYLSQWKIVYPTLIINSTWIIEGYSDNYISSRIKTHDSSDDAHSNQFSSLSSHLTNYNNPHQVTKSQIGLGNVENISITGSINTHNTSTDSHSDMREEIGKCLSTNVLSGYDSSKQYAFSPNTDGTIKAGSLSEIIIPTVSFDNTTLTPNLSGSIQAVGVIDENGDLIDASEIRESINSVANAVFKNDIRHVSIGTDLFSLYNLSPVYRIQMPDYGFGYTISRIVVRCYSTPIKQLDANIMYCDTWTTGSFPSTNPTLVRAIDTTSGNYDSGAISINITSGKELYILMDANVDYGTMWDITLTYQMGVN